MTASAFYFSVIRLFSVLQNNLLLTHSNEHDLKKKTILCHKCGSKTYDKPYPILVK
jgi:hypothetical protein